MNRRWADDDDNDSNDEDASWQGDDDDMVPCPNCQRQIYEGSERCPYCEKYISDEDTPPERKPTWVIITALILLLLIYLSFFH